MPVSQNGWLGIESGSDARLTPLSWITGRVLRGDVHTIFDYVCRRWHSEVEPIRRDWSWGHYYRAIRGASSLSNHASGTSVDLNAPQHPLGKRNTFSATQRAAIRRILADVGGVVRWGGDYSGRPDDMHLEVVGTAAQVAAVARRISGGAAPVSEVASKSGTATPAPNLSRPTFPTVQEDDMQADERQALFQIRDVLGANGGLNTETQATIAHLVRGMAPQVTDVQAALTRDLPNITSGLNAIRGDTWDVRLALTNALPALLGGPDVDTAALAAAIAPLLASTTPALTDTDLARVASAVADEQARRLTNGA